MDKRKNNGGKRAGAGRKPKAEELKLIDKLDKIIDSDKAIEKLKQLISDDNFNALKLYIEYRFGKPKETIEQTNINIGENDLTPAQIKKLNDTLENEY